MSEHELDCMGTMWTWVSSDLEEKLLEIWGRGIYDLTYIYEVSMLIIN